MRVLYAGQDDPLDEEMATYSSILPGESPRMEGTGGLQSIGSQGVKYSRSDLVPMHVHLKKHEGKKNTQVRTKVKKLQKNRHRMLLWTVL